MAKHNPESDDFEWLSDLPKQPAPEHEENMATVNTSQLPETQPRRSFWRRQSGAYLVAFVIVMLILVVYLINRHGGPDNGRHEKTVAAHSGQPGHSVAPKSPTQAECIAKLPLALRLGQKLMISANANNISEVAAAVSKYNLGGVIFMSPVPTAAQVHQYFDGDKVALLKATDQEGYPLERYKDGGTLPTPSWVPLHWSPSVAEKNVEQSDNYLRNQGVNMNFAPLADVAPTNASSVLGNRIFSANPDTVAAYDRAYVQAGLATGVLPTLKHFPGLGSATGNTDYGSATVPELSQLQTRDLIPYRSQKGTKAAVMVGNQIVPELTDGLPASLSRAAVSDLLRSQLGYRSNIVITDSLSAVAITSRYTITQAALMAWEAGNDEALTVTYDPGLGAEQQVAQIIQAGESAVNSGQLTETEINTSDARLFLLPQKQVDACKL